MPGMTMRCEKRYMELARLRHEQANRLFKLFKVLSNTFRRDVKKHKYFMLDVANIVQMGLMTGEMDVFDVRDHMARPPGW
jgi:hypothetical protein